MRALETIAHGTGEFSELVRKLFPKARSSARVLARATGLSVEDTAQEVVINMWQSFELYFKTQASYAKKVRYDGLLWEVIESCEPYHLLKHPSQSREEIVEQSACEPVRKASLFSFVFMRMEQWHWNFLAAHYVTRNGYTQPDKDAPRHAWKTKRVIFEDSYEARVDSGFDAASCIETPEDKVILNDLVRQTSKGLSFCEKQVLHLYATEGLALPQQGDRSDTEYAAYLLGFSKKTMDKVLRQVARALPEDVLDCTIARRTAQGIILRQPAKTLLGEDGLTSLKVQKRRRNARKCTTRAATGGTN